MKPVRTIVLVAAALLITIATASRAAEPLAIRIAYANITGTLVPIYDALPPGILRHHGKSYVAESIFLAGSTRGLTALAAKEIEIAQLTPQSLALGVVEAKLGIKVIGQAFSTELPGYAKSMFWVRKDDVTRIEDLKGKVLAVNARGSAVAAAVTLMMRRHGMEAGRDYQVVEVRFPAMLSALESGRVSLAYLLRPWNHTAEKNPALMPLFGPGEVYGPSETGIWAVYSEFLDKHRAVLVDFLEDEIRVRRWAHDPKTRMDAVRIMAKATKRAPEDLAELYTTDENAYRHPDLVVDVERLQRNVNHMHEANVVPDTIEAAKFVDMSLAREAKARFARN